MFAAPVSIIPCNHRPSQLYMFPVRNPKAKDGRKATHSPSNMPLQPLLPVLVHGMPLPNLTQTVPHQELIIPRREQRRRHIDQDCNPAVVHVAEGFATEEYSRHDPRSKVTSEVCRNRNIGKAPDHGSVCETDGERGAGCRDERVRRVETGPDNDADVGVDEEFGQEEVAEISGNGII